MKKIIATVLAMVMALALCSTAFAAPATYDKAYNEKGKDITAGATYTVTTDAATYDKTSGSGKVETKIVNWGSGDHYYVQSTKADYDLKLTSDTQADLYLTEVVSMGRYECKAAAFTAIGTKCGQYDGVTTSKYYTNTNKYMAKDDVVLFRESDASTAVNVLVDGKLVKVTYVGKLDDLTNPHDWKAASYDKDGKALTFKCAECGTVATVYKTEDAAWAAGVNTVEVFKGYVLGYNFNAENAGSTTTTGSKPSPKTFDAGIALYAAMALTSVAGSAVVIGKKKEF